MLNIFLSILKGFTGLQVRKESLIVIIRLKYASVREQELWT